MWFDKCISLFRFLEIRMMLVLWVWVVSRCLWILEVVFILSLCDGCVVRIILGLVFSVCVRMIF